MDRINSVFANNAAARQVFFDKIFYDSETNNLDNDSFVTELSAHHLSGRYLKQYVIDILYDLECTNVVAELDVLKEKMKEHLRKAQNELRSSRENAFVVYNQGRDDVYGTLADNKIISDRDAYIKELVDYYETINSLQRIAQGKAKGTDSLIDESYQPFSELQYNALIFLGDSFSEDSVRLCNLSCLFGDLSAVNNLMHNIYAEVPDFTFNHGRSAIN